MDNDVKPLFKYIGGKRWLKENLRTNFQKILSDRNEENYIDTYVEPFVGGMGAFLSVYDVLENAGIKKIILNDINTNIINFYKIINEQDGFKSDDLIINFIHLEKDFLNLIPNGTKHLHKQKEKHIIKQQLKDANNFFLSKRKRFNELLKIEKKGSDEIVEISALLLFLQSHCFNGIYRENSKGEYNTPFNWEVKEKTQKQITNSFKMVKEIFDKFDLTLLNVSALDLNFNKTSFYYLDPPYLNEDEEGENKYNKEHFNKTKQFELIALLDGLNFVYSNHNSEILIKEFENFKNKCCVEIVTRKNIISASIESRKEDKEEIIISSKNS